MHGNGSGSNHVAAHRDQVLDALRRADVFSALSGDERAAIAQYATVRAYGPRRVVFWQGDACTHLYVVVDGGVKLNVGAEARQKVLDFVGPGGLFGEEAVFSGDDHRTTAATLSPATLVAIEAAPFARFAQNAPRAAWAMLNGLSRRVTRLALHMERLASSSAEHRLAAYLLADDAAEGEDTPAGGARMPLAAPCPSRRDLASHLAITPETLSRTIAAFRGRNWIEAGRRGIAVLDPDRLAELLAD